VKRSTLITGIVLVAVVIAIVVALFMEAAAGPTFRAEDYGSLQECVANIPVEWGRGTLQRDGAEQSCMYVHGRGR
jgi:hypothetical protein